MSLLLATSVAAALCPLHLHAQCLLGLDSLSLLGQRDGLSVVFFFSWRIQLFTMFFPEW